jgi:hypothetical protein
MFFFNTRKLAREFANKNPNYKLVDNGTFAKKRWGVKTL